MRLTWIAPFTVAGCLTAGQDDGGFAFGEATNGVGEGSESGTTLLTTGIEPTTAIDPSTGVGSSSGSESTTGSEATSSSSSPVSGDTESSGGEPRDPVCGDGVVEGDESCDGDDLGGASCASLGYTGGTLACADCSFDTSACDAGDFLEDWETGAMSGDWVLGGDSNWVLAGGTPIAGTWSARSGNIGANDESSLSIDLNFPRAGSISFTHRESTEPSYDELLFFIDGVEQDAWSGANPATLASYDVAAGTHTFEWRYAKDFSFNVGLDAVWVDDIAADGGGPL